MKLSKKLESKLLDDIYFGWFLVTKGGSNNGAFYVLEKDGEKIYLKVVDNKQAEEEGLDEVKLTELASGSKSIAKLQKTNSISDRYQYLEFEYINGKDLREVDQLDNNELEKLATQMTEAISGLWENGVVHRDIKPGNIMKDISGNFVLVDLGIGYYMNAPDRDTTKARGSRFYSSPEQFMATIEDEVEITFSSDLYSLGMVLFEKATGEHPKSSWGKKYSCYGELINKTEPPRVDAKNSELPKKLVAFINKLLQVNKGDRFLAPEQAINFLKEVEEAQKSGNILLYDTAECALIDSYLDDDSAPKPDGIVVTLRRSESRIQSLARRGFNVIIDPTTYKLTYPDSRNISLKEKLGYKAKASFNANRLAKEKDEVIRRTLELQKDSKLLILPYFAIQSNDDPLLGVSKTIWLSGKEIANEIDNTKDLYGGLVIPASITTERSATRKLINLIHSSYDVVGFYLIFEAPNNTVTTIDSIDYLQNVKKIINTFSSMGEVLIGHSDISNLLLCSQESTVFGWSNSQRRFNYENMLHGKPSGWYQKQYDPKVLYYISQLLTFVKGEQDLVQLAEFAPEDSIDCSCDSCRELLPYDGKSPKEPKLASRHFFETIVNQHKSFTSNPLKGRQEALEVAAKLTKSIKESSSNTVGGKIIPNHEAILSVVDY